MVLVFVKFLVLSCHWFGEGYNIRNRSYMSHILVQLQQYMVLCFHIYQKEKKGGAVEEKLYEVVNGYSRNGHIKFLRKAL
jgi:hypothetical protein